MDYHSESFVYHLSVFSVGVVFRQGSYFRGFRIASLLFAGGADPLVSLVNDFEPALERLFMGKTDIFFYWGVLHMSSSYGRTSHYGHGTHTTDVM